MSTNETAYWCHQCKQAIQPQPAEMLVCPGCKSEFIEALEMDEDPPQTSATNSFHSPFSSTPSTSTPQNFVPFSTNSFPSFPSNGPRPQNFSPFFPPNPSTGTTTAANFVFGTSNHHPYSQNAPFEQISHILNGLLREPAVNNILNGMFGGQNVNMADYAWGNNGFEDLVNQLFVTHRSQGPPPTAQEAIESLHQVSITQEQVDEKLDCVICKDEFELQQGVLQLPCGHVFHNGCIVRWLKMHNQCPVCRFELPSEERKCHRGQCRRR